MRADLLQLITEALRLIPASDMTFSPANVWREKADAILRGAAINPNEHPTPLARHIAAHLYEGDYLRQFATTDGQRVVGIEIDRAIEEFASQ